MPPTKSPTLKSSGINLSEPSGNLFVRRQRVDLVQGVVALLEKHIISGEMVSGQSLPPEGLLSRDLGVSRTVIREAMRILGAKGLVEVSQGKLPRVKPVDSTQVVDSLATFLQRADHSLLHLLEVRRHLETSIVALAAERATPEQVDALKELNQQFEKTDNLEQLIDADMRFHALLAEATNNPVFGLLLEPLAHLMRLSRKETLTRSGPKAAAKGHAKLIAAIGRGDPEASRRAMLEHLDLAEQDLEETKAKK
jgi:GntR family transcriptional regulator, transcriptional repressor for pyruvate dehydrogenase complex